MKRIWKCYKYIYANMYKFNYKLIIEQGLEILFAVLAPLCATLLPSFIIGTIEKNISMQRMLFSIIGIFIVYALLLGLQNYYDNTNFYSYINFRTGPIYSQLIGKLFSVDIDYIEDPKGQTAFMKGFHSLLGNYDGLEGMIHKLTLLLTNIIGLIIYLCIISTINIYIFLLLIVLSLTQIFIYNYVSKLERNRKEELNQQLSKHRYYNKLGFDVASGKDIRLYHLQKWINDADLSVLNKISSIKSKDKAGYLVYDLIVEIEAFIRNLVCYLYLIHALVSQNMSIATFVLYLGIVTGLSKWLVGISENYVFINSESYKVEDFLEFLKVTSKEKGTVKIDNQPMSIEFKHVYFKYPHSDQYILKDLNFKIDADKKIGLVGINGAGKTTIIKLICGFYSPSKGEVLINDIPVNSLDLEDYYNYLSVVFQSPLVLNTSILDNVGQDEKRVKEVLEKVGLMDKINTLDKGLNTYIGKTLDESGIELSGGELQKLALARALYKNGRILLLDEPTAAMDAINEQKLYEQFNEISTDTTSIFISHRLASTKFLDEILFLEDGRIVERGNHDTLMNLKGKYYEMFEVQSKYYKEKEYDQEY